MRNDRFIGTKTQQKILDGYKNREKQYDLLEYWMAENCLVVRYLQAGIVIMKSYGPRGGQRPTHIMAGDKTIVI